jgi:uncharacterized protein
LPKPRIAVIAAGLLIVSTIVCSASFAQDQGQALIEAAKQGDLRQVQELLKKRTDINAKNNAGSTALTMASFGGHIETVKFLLDGGADFNAKNKFGETPLMLASKGGHVAVVKLLKALGAKE